MGGACGKENSVVPNTSVLVRQAGGKCTSAVSAVRERVVTSLQCCQACQPPGTLPPALAVIINIILMRHRREWRVPGHFYSGAGVKPCFTRSIATLKWDKEAASSHAKLPCCGQRCHQLGRSRFPCLAWLHGTTLRGRQSILIAYIAARKRAAWSHAVRTFPAKISHVNLC